SAPARHPPYRQAGRARSPCRDQSVRARRWLWQSPAGPHRTRSGTVSRLRVREPAVLAHRSRLQAREVETAGNRRRAGVLGPRPRYGGFGLVLQPAPAPRWTPQRLATVPDPLVRRFRLACPRRLSAPRGRVEPRCRSGSHLARRLRAGHLIPGGRARQLTENVPSFAFLLAAAGVSLDRLALKIRVGTDHLLE